MDKLQPSIAHPTSIKALSGTLQVETYYSPGHDCALVTQIADFYRWIFNNVQPDGHFLYYPEMGEFRSPQEVFDTDATHFVDLELMDSLEPLPPHPITGEIPIIWHDPKTVRCIIQEKLIDRGFVSILRDRSSESIEGLLFGHLTTLQEQFHNEGWEDPFHYTGKTYPGVKRSFSVFQDQLNAAVSQNPELASIPELKKTGGQFVPETEIHSWNTIATSPSYRDRQFLFPLINGYFTTIPKNLALNCPAVGESRVGSKSYELFHAAGYKDVPGILSSKPLESLTERDSTIIVTSAKELSKVFSKSAKAFLNEHYRPYILRKKSKTIPRPSTPGIV